MISHGAQRVVSAVVTKGDYTLAPSEEENTLHLRSFCETERDTGRGTEGGDAARQQALTLCRRLAL